MSCTNCGSAFHEKWACPKPLRGAAVLVKPIEARSTIKQPALNDRSHAGEVGSGQPVKVARQPSGPRKSDRHPPGYMADYMRKRRAKLKAP